MIKLFAYKDGYDLENRVNEWLLSNNVKILELKYHPLEVENEISHNLIIHYEYKEKSDY